MSFLFMKLSSSPTIQWFFSESGAPSWHEAEVPGCVHTDLMRHKLIPPPFLEQNEDKLQWIEERAWRYRCDFDLEDGTLKEEHVELVAEGLDTLAEVILNGEIIANTENMFSEYRWDVRSLLKPTGNRLEIVFSSPMEYIRARQSPADMPEANDPVGGSSHIRKEQCSFGWDWGPRLATCGIYKPLRLHAWSRNRIRSARIEQQHKDGAVTVKVHPDLVRKGQVAGVIRRQGKTVATLKDDAFHIRKPELWWPAGHGSQPLYEIEITLIERGEVVDTWQRRIGLRTIVLDRHADEFGETFQFVVNGRAIFAKGANWIPAHSFVTEVGRQDYDDLLTSAVEANMNMIRVWGGGIYEMEEFYDLCDEKGLLVWQDFMFACALYPGTKEFLRSVEQEARHQVTRLAHRACLALWCGNNEIEQSPAEILRTRQRKAAYETVFYKILPDAVARYDGVTAYWPSTPHNPAGYELGHNSEDAGDSHFWEVWHARKPVNTYETKRFRFCSEFGMQSYSSPQVARTFCPTGELNVLSPVMEAHQKNPAGNLIILEYISRRYRFPLDYASLAYLSQLNQAYCMKVGVEHFRRSMPCTMGSLYWQLNDTWPGFSWSSLEFGGRWKALHYTARRFYAPVLVSAHLLGDETQEKHNRLRNTIREVALYAVSDLARATKARLEWTLYHIDGRQLLSAGRHIRLEPGTSRLVETLDLSHEIARHGRNVLYLRIALRVAGEIVSQDTAFLTAPKFMELPRTKIRYAARRKAAGLWELEFHSKGFHHQVEFDLGETAFRASDNFFDLYPGESHTVEARLAENLTLADIKQRLTMRSLADTYGE